MAQRKRGDCHVVTLQSASGPTKRASAAHAQGCENRFDLAAGAGVDDVNSQSECGGAALERRSTGSAFGGLAGLTRTATWTASGSSSRKRPSRFPISSAEKNDTCDIAARSSEARDQTHLTGSSGTPKTMGIVEVAASAARAANALPGVAITSPGDALGQPQALEAIGLGLRPSGIRSLRSDLRHGRPRPDLVERRRLADLDWLADRCGGSSHRHAPRLAAARSLRAASPRPLHRPA